MEYSELVKALPYFATFSDGKEATPFVAKLMEKLSKKTTLQTKFGTTQQKYEQAVSIPVNPDLKYTFSYLLKSLPNDDELHNKTFEELLELFKTNKLPSGAKFSRKLTTSFHTKQGLTNVYNYVASLSSTGKNRIKQPLPNVKGKLNYIADYEDIVTATFDYLSSNNNVTLGLGWSFDIAFNCTTSSAFSSCMKIHSAEVSSLLRLYAFVDCEQMAFIYIQKNNTVTGRAAVIFNEDYTAYCVKPVYGSLTRAHMLIVVDYINNTLGGDWFVAPSGVYNMRTYTDNYLYDDSNILQCTSIREGNTFIIPSSINFKNKQHNDECIICGKNTGNEPNTYSTYNKCICEECMKPIRKKCSVCNLDIHFSDICSACKSSDYKCVSCSAKISSSNQRYMNGLCTKCATEKVCTVCNKMHVKDLITIDEYTKVCLDCYEELVTVDACKLCGNKDVLLIEGHALCENCYTNISYLNRYCNDKGYVFKDNNVIDKAYNQLQHYLSKELVERYLTFMFDSEMGRTNRLYVPKELYSSFNLRNTEEHIKQLNTFFFDASRMSRYDDDDDDWDDDDDF